MTFLFCAFDTANLVATFDAEDWRNIIVPYLEAASAGLRKFDGHVFAGLGDSLTAVFGYPHARENDAERAVRAALAIQKAIGDLNDHPGKRRAPRLSARIGLDAGKVVVDSMGGVFGKATSIAARVQAAAEPGSVLVTANVQRQVAGLFVAEDRGAHELRGVPQPVNLYRIVRAATGPRRAGLRTLTPLAGRARELALLTRRWERARSGEGQLALIVGEPGIGKSRLLKEFQTRLSEAPHTWMEWSASQLLQNTPLHPIAEWGRQRFDIGEAPAERLGELEKVLKAIGLEAIAPLVAPLLDIALPLSRVETGAPDDLRRRQLAAIEFSILAGSRVQPLVLAFEDLQWSDPTSLDLLSALAESGARAPLYILATARSEFQAPWRLRPHHALIAIPPLNRANVRRMIGSLAARDPLSKHIVDTIGERTGGVPLFVEEVTRLLLERSEQSDVEAIPPTLQQSLSARLDNLGAEREIAEMGAVLGREFSYALLRDVAGLPDASLQASLARLTNANILLVDGAAPEARYRFRHALIQDAAYENLIKSDRQALHVRAAEVLRDSAAARGSYEPEAIAHHFTQAGEEDLAIQWWGKAGDQALRRSAFREAISHLGKAIELADGRACDFRPRDSRGSKAEAAVRLCSGRDVVEGLCSRRDTGCVRSRSRARRALRQCGGAVQRIQRPVGAKLYARRIARGARHGRGLPARSRS